MKLHRVTIAAHWLGAWATAQEQQAVTAAGRKPLDHKTAQYTKAHCVMNYERAKAEDGWLAFLIDEHGRCYACDLPYEVTAFGSLDDLLFSSVGEKLTLRHPVPAQVE